MKQRTIIRGLAVAVILLFIGIGVQPAIAEKLTQEQPDVEGLVAKIDNIVNEILQEYKHNKMVGSINDLIYYNIGLSGRYPLIFCTLFLIALSPFFIFLIKMWEIFSLDIFLEMAAILLYPFGLICYYPWINSLSEIKDIIQSFDGCPCLQE